MSDDEATPAVTTLSPVVAEFLLQVVNSIQLPVASEHFEQQAALVVMAKRELSNG